MSRGKFAMWGLFGMVFLIGALTLTQQITSLWSRFVAGQVSHVQTYGNTGGGTGQSSNAGTGGADQTANIGNAPFAYLMPGSSSEWSLDTSQSTYDPAKGIVKYQLSLTSPKTGVTITQQEYPNKLKPRGGQAFTAFINGTQPSRSVDVNAGTLYFLPMLQNGSPAVNGTDTVIFARDDVLMFGQAQSLVTWNSWVQIMASMQKVAAK